MMHGQKNIKLCYFSVRYSTFIIINILNRNMSDGYFPEM